MTILVRNSKCQALLFCGRIKLFQTYFFNILNAPLSDLSWKMEICRPEDLREGAFSICPEIFNSQLASFHFRQVSSFLGPSVSEIK